MNKKQLIKLIYSDKTEDYIAEQILLCYEKNPALIDEMVLTNDNIFYHLAINNKAKVFEKLLDSGQLKVISLWADKKGNTILHKIVQQSIIHKETWLLITIHLPELLNVQNKSGNTPLHEAVNAKQVWAIAALANNLFVNQNIKNHQGITPLELAKDNKIITDAFSPATQYSISPLDFSKLGQHIDSVHSIRESFPLLSGSRLNLTSSSSSSSSLVYDNSKLSQVDLSNVFNGIVLLDDFKELISNSDTINRQKMISKFCTSCVDTCLYNEEELTPWLSNQHDSREIIHKIITQLYPLVNTEWIQHQNIKLKLTHQFIESLKLNSKLLNTQPHQVIKPNFAELDTEHHGVLEMLWTLAEKQPAQGENLNAYLERMKHRSIGLMDKIDFNQVIIHFKNLYPHFSQHQKLVANYIVWQLLKYHKLEIIQTEQTILLNLKPFLHCNVKPKIGLGRQGIEINGHYSSWSAFNFVFYNLPLIKNHSILIKWCQKLSNNQLDFDELFDLALSKTSSERIKEVTLIANEMRSVSLAFYQEVPIKDFCSIKNGSTPSLVDLLINNFNKLNNYFIVKILSQPSVNRVNALRLILELAHELCPLDTEYTLDLNHLMLIASVLNTACISRLKNCFNSLSSKEQGLIKEIERLVSKENNSKWMREIGQVYKSTLAFPGNFLTDLTFAKDGNNDKSKVITQAEVIGKILLKIFEIKERIELDVYCHFSNLPGFLKQYKPVNDNNLYAISLKIQPKASDVIELPSTAQNLIKVLKKLDQQFLNNKVIPLVNFHGAIYTPNLLAIKLIKYFSEQINFFKKSPIDQQYFLLKTLNKLKNTMEKLVDVNNLCYYPRYHQEKLNLYYFLFQINKLKRILDPEIPLSKKISKLPSSKSQISLKELIQLDEVKSDKLTRYSNLTVSSRKLSFFPSAPSDKSKKEMKAQVTKTRRKSWFAERTLIHNESESHNLNNPKKTLDNSARISWEV